MTLLDNCKPVEGGIAAPSGFVAGGAVAGIKPSGNSDLAGVFSEAGECSAAGVFTTNVVKAPSIRYNRAVVGRGRAQAIVCNSGIANACTGQGGFEDNMRMASAMASRVAISSDLVLVCSTGVIGHRLPMGKIESGIGGLQLTLDGGPRAAEAIMTTDTFAKYAALELDTPAGPVRIGGMCKGAGMIHPNMATMLAFLSTDAAIDADLLKTILIKAVDDSFNMISIDGDTSTNDSVLFLANGAAGVTIGPDAAVLEEFSGALGGLCVRLAKEIIRGGEGVSKVFAVTVRGAASTTQARTIARSVTTSNLLKAAVHGSDPNWGRILCAAGYSGANFDPDRTDVWIGPYQVFGGGVPRQYPEADASSYLNGPESEIVIDLRVGPSSAVAWGCDLSKEYVEINAEYTT